MTWVRSGDEKHLQAQLYPEFIRDPGNHQQAGFRSKHLNRKSGGGFRRFLDTVVAEPPINKEIHVIVDNYRTHKRDADWLDKYEGRVQSHFTPTSASYLNQVEIWFGLLTRKALRGTSFANKDQLRSAIASFVTKTTEHPKPFHWRKCEIEGSQLRDIIINLCN